MGKRIFASHLWIPDPVADAIALANGDHQSLQGASGSTAQVTKFYEFMISGFAAASAVCYLMFARHVVLMATPTALATPNSDGPLSSQSLALAAPIAVGIAASTPPQRSSATTSPKINLGLNAFGGILKYNAGPDQEFQIFGDAVTTGGAGLSSFTGSSASATISSDIMYETV